MQQTTQIKEIGSKSLPALESPLCKGDSHTGDFHNQHCPDYPEPQVAHIVIVKLWLIS
jgi:hypothetical protein